MTAGFDLGLSSRQTEMQERLNAVSLGELRAAAARAERDGVNGELLVGILDDAGLAPGTLMAQGYEDPHTLLVAIEELAYGDADIAWATASSFQVAILLVACGSTAQRATAGEVLSPPDATTSVLLYEDFGRQPSEYETRVTTGAEGATVTGFKRSVAHPGGADLSLLVGREGTELSAFCFTGSRAAITVERRVRSRSTNCTRLQTND
jgi:acyl-CoA dehydrogenase